LTYYGHCAFLWQTAQGLRVLADPYRNRHDRYWFTRRFPHVECDLALITHAHFDHDAADCLPEAASVLRMPGRFQHLDMSILGILDRHSGRSGRLNFPNVMYRLEANGISFLHIGDNRADWPTTAGEAVGRVDVLMVTVDDSCHLLSYQVVDSLIARLTPRIVIPMHYLIPGLIPESTTLRTPDGWLATQTNVRRLGCHSIALSPEDLPGNTQVWVFEPSPESLAAPPVQP
jgi:L-ascorbate metabolism protein UlaG (beta-lactamase superfamily)